MDLAEKIGALPAPPGITPNFHNPETRVNQVIIVSVVCPVIALVFLLLRIYTKHYIIGKLHLDDYSIALAWVFALGYSIIQIVQTKNGSGYHIWDITVAMYVRFNQVGISAAFTYGLSTIFIKVSILLFYLRFSLPNGYFRTVIYVMIFIVIGYSFFGAFAFLYLCKPIRKFWDFTTPGTCVNIGINFFAMAGLNAATDLILLCLPIWLLWPLRLPTMQKVGVTLILMTGSFVFGVSVVRMAEIPHGLVDPDSTWQFVNNIIWCIIEMYTGIVCACLPSLRTFAKHHFPQIFDRPDDPQSVMTGWTRSRTNPILTQELGVSRVSDHGNIPMSNAHDSSRSSHSIATSAQGDHSFKSSLSLIQPPKAAASSNEHEVGVR